MSTSRKSFIRATGLTSLGFGFLPSLVSAENIFDMAAPLTRKSPESQGVSSKAIREFIKAANNCNYEWHSFMLLRHGNVIAEGWWKPFEPQYKHTLYSLSKSFTSTAIGMLVTEGKLTVNDKVLSFFPKEAPASPDANLQKMQVKHLLTMNTGHAEDTMGKLRAAGNNWMQAFLAQPVAFEPGTHFLYNTGATYMLGAIVYKLTGKKLEEYLAPRLFQPLGIEGYDWELSPEGLNTAGYGLRVRTEDIARFGQLYLQKGKWNGKQVLSQAWVDEATSYQTKSNEGNGDWSQGYGYQFWRCKPGFYRGDGAYGQYCIVMPQYDAVLAITGESWNLQQSMTVAWDTLLPAMQSAALPDSQEWNALKTDLQELTLPVPKAIATPASVSAFNGRQYKLADNKFGATAMGFQFAVDGCIWTIKTAQGNKTIRFGSGKWVTNEDNGKYPFASGGQFHVPSKTAGVATWKDDNSLLLTLKFVESVHSDNITVVFSGDSIKVSFLNSVSTNVKNNIENRVALEGNIV
jgi:hypothetical protein